ncbi:MAG: aldehyde dehydrogenase [Gammaproteobacteria bacterium]|nr:aldehyde dehydrogenase [Gammaproteobacteria bacterium]
MYETGLIIGARNSDFDAPHVFERINPKTDEVVNRAIGASEQEASAACDAAAEAFKEWSKTGPGLRRDLLLKAEEAMKARVPDIVAAMEAELGASAPWSGFNVHLAQGLIREAASLTTAITGQTIPSDIPGLTATTTRRPCGVIVSIAPWNAPVILSTRAIAMPLACGNTVVLKGSEICPETHRLVVQSFIDAGFPPGVLNYVNNHPADGPKIVATLIRHKDVKRVNFTGSSNTGRIIAKIAAAELKPCLLELGGKSPMIVLDDADLDEAARAANFGSFMNTGQICMATEKLVVDEKIADAFVEKFVASASRLGIDDTCQIPLGPLAMQNAPMRISALIEDALKKGARAVLRGAANGALMSPTILDHVTPEMDIYHEESFGPVTAIVRFSTVEEAIAIANDTEYGLAASVFGQDIGRAMAVADRLDAGNRHVNMATIHDQPQMPFGGLKASGYGRFNGLEAINEFTDTVLTTVRTTPAVHYPF